MRESERREHQSWDVRIRRYLLVCWDYIYLILVNTLLILENIVWLNMVLAFGLLVLQLVIDRSRIPGMFF